MSRAPSRELVVRVLLTGLSLAISLPSSLYASLNNGIDTHWKAALWWSIQRGLVFGKDVVFPYGPLGYLEVRPGFAGVGPRLLLWDALFYAALGLVLFRVYASLSSLRERLAAFACVAAMGLGEGVNGAGLLLPLELYFLFGYVLRRDVLWLVAAALTACVGFYVKVSTGLVGVMLLMPCLVYAAASRREHRRPALYAALGSLGLLLVSAWLLHVDLPSYVRGGLELIRGYPEAMARDEPGYEYLIWMAVGLLAAFAASLFRGARAIVREHDQLLCTALTAGVYFMYFKQGFVRFDSWHYMQFFQLGPFVPGALYVHSDADGRRRLWLPLVLAIAASVSFTLPALDGPALLQRARAIQGYVGEATDWVEQPRLKKALRHLARLPRTFVTRIGKATVDVWPHDPGQALRHGLAYAPRPVLQSYAAFTPYLDGLDADFYASARAPEFVVYSHTALWSPPYTSWWTTPRTRLSLLTHYEGVRLKGEQLLLQRRERPLVLVPGRRWSGTGRLFEALDVPASASLVMFKASVKASAAGSLRSLVFAPAELDLEIRLAEGVVGSAVVRAHLADGLPLTPWVGDVRQARAAFGGALESLPAAVQLTLRTPNPGAYRTSYDYEFSELLLSHPDGTP